MHFDSLRISRILGLRAAPVKAGIMFTVHYSIVHSPVRD